MGPQSSPEGLLGGSPFPSHLDCGQGLTSCPSNTENDGAPSLSSPGGQAEEPTGWTQTRPWSINPSVSRTWGSSLNSPYSRPGLQAPLAPVLPAGARGPSLVSVPLHPAHCHSACAPPGLRAGDGGPLWAHCLPRCLHTVGSRRTFPKQVNDFRRHCGSAKDSITSISAVGRRGQLQPQPQDTTLACRPAHPPLRRREVPAQGSLLPFCFRDCV